MQVTNIAKPFFDIQHAAWQFETVAKDSPPKSKARQLLGSYAKKLQWIINDFTTELPEGFADLVRKDVGSYDGLVIPACLEELVLMTPEQREVAEVMLKDLRTGKIQVS
jgi:hypothetical protein